MMNQHVIGIPESGSSHARRTSWALCWPILLLVFQLAACGKSVELVSGLAENEANETLGALLNAGIDAHKVATKTGTTINVEQSVMAKAIGVLHQQGLPRERRANMGDVFKKENLISSPLEERARYLYALSQELERTLSHIDGVVEARVHVVLPERIGPGEPAVPSSASVFLKYQAGYGVDAVVAQVKALAANSIPGLNQNKVAVVLVPAVTDANGEHALHLENVLFLRIERGSVAALWAILGSLSLTLLLAFTAAIHFAIPDARYGPAACFAKLRALRKRPSPEPHL